MEGYDFDEAVFAGERKAEELLRRIADLEAELQEARRLLAIVAEYEDNLLAVRDDEPGLYCPICGAHVSEQDEWHRWAGNKRSTPLVERAHAFLRGVDDAD